MTVYFNISYKTPLSFKLPVKQKTGVNSNKIAFSGRAKSTLFVARLIKKRQSPAEECRLC
ncbi:MAG: hypothetical protein CR988_00510 [Treponema sp.]|nr:MAG: hypothetical protein CR988_00510 [Treponema sp.]